MHANFSLLAPSAVTLQPSDSDRIQPAGDTEHRDWSSRKCPSTYQCPCFRRAWRALSVFLKSHRLFVYLIRRQSVSQCGHRVRSFDWLPGDFWRGSRTEFVIYTVRVRAPHNKTQLKSSISANTIIVFYINCTNAHTDYFILQTPWFASSKIHELELNK